VPPPRRSSVSGRPHRRGPGRTRREAGNRGFAEQILFRLPPARKTAPNLPIRKEQSGHRSSRNGPATTESGTLRALCRCRIYGRCRARRRWLERPRDRRPGGWRRRRGRRRSGRTRPEDRLRAARPPRQERDREGENQEDATGPPCRPRQKGRRLAAAEQRIGSCTCGSHRGKPAALPCLKQNDHHQQDGVEQEKGEK